MSAWLQIMENPLTEREQRVLSCVCIQGDYCGVSYIAPLLIAEQARMDISHVRKALKSLEADGWLRAEDTPNGGWAFRINPYRLFAGDRDQERMAKRIWDAGERKRLKQMSNVVPITRGRKCGP